MTEPRPAIAIAVGTICFGAALALRTVVDPWLATGAVAAVSALVAAWALGRARLRQLFSSHAGGVLRAALLGVGLVLATHVAFRAVAPLLGAHVAHLYASIDVATPRAARAALTLGVVVAEELVWRGCAVEVAGPVLAVALYALPQVAGGEWILVAAALGLGVVLDQQRRRSGNVVEPLVTHAIWSVAIFVVVPLAQ